MLPPRVTSEVDPVFPSAIPPRVILENPPGIKYRISSGNLSVIPLGVLSGIPPRVRLEIPTGIPSWIPLEAFFLRFLE